MLKSDPYGQRLQPHQAWSMHEGQLSSCGPQGQLSAGNACGQLHAVVCVVTCQCAL